jgi:2-dehydropantoate 2-reductase
MALRDILIVGGGAIGGLTGAALARKGFGVTILDTDPEQVSAMLEGLEITCSDAVKKPIMGEMEAKIPIDSFTPDSFRGEADIALICVKSQHTIKALSPLRRMSGDFPVVSLQNGVNEEILSEILGERVLGCVIFWGCTNLGAGRLRQTADGGSIVGRWPRGRSDVVRDVAELLNQAFPTEVSDNIIGHIWNKLLINVSMTGTGYISGYTFGKVLDDELALRVALTLLVEAYSVGEAWGIDFGEMMGVHPSAIVELIKSDYSSAVEVIRGAFSGNRDTVPSPLQDLEKGRRTEINHLNGYVVRKGREVGIEVPANEMVMRFSSDLDSGKRSPCRGNLREFRSVVL